MPNIITHKIFAEEVLKKINKKDIRTIIEKHLQLYYIGSNGPDFLFFHNAKPWEFFKNHDIEKIGGQLHKTGVNEFYKSAIKSIRKEEDMFVYENMMAYIFGHLCHWALDTTTHPFIFYKTGNCVGKSSGYHHRFESMLDTMMLRKYHDLDIKDYPFYEICEYDDEMLKAIARIYVPAVKKALDKEIKVYDLRVSLNEWKDIQKLLYDPNSLKKPMLMCIEKLINKPNLISGNIVEREVDNEYDIMNLQHEIWMNPCANGTTSFFSFFNLFEEAIKLAVSVIEHAYGSIEYGADINEVCNILDDRAYDTGVKGNKKMKFFNIIYEEGFSEDL